MKNIMNFIKELFNGFIEAREASALARLHRYEEARNIFK